ncbi:hypothetical protein [Oceanobacillus senegalensis]|nr:hypothetical protein [Oceanobacillus senegalensis]
MLPKDTELNKSNTVRIAISQNTEGLKDKPILLETPDAWKKGGVK